MITKKERDRGNETIEVGISILAQEAQQKSRDKKKPKSNHDSGPDTFNPHNAGLSFRLKSLRTLLVYLLLFVVMAGILVALDGAPHLPARIWSWTEIWDKLSGPSAGVPLDFIKYLTCSLGWFMLAYVAFTLVVEGLVDVLYLLSVRLGGGRPGRIARGLKKATRLLPVSPARRALDGLLLGVAFFAVVTTVAGGSSASSGGNNNVAGGSDLDWPVNGPEAAGLVLETYQAGYTDDNNTQSTPLGLYKTSFQPHYNTSPNFDNDPTDDMPTQTVQTSLSGKMSAQIGGMLLSQQSGEVRHKVQAGDTLWSLAERYYNDGQLYTQIYEANLGQPVGGGSHFDASGKIQPGWVLTVPNATKLDSADKWDMTAVSQNRVQEQKLEVYVVQIGDSMRAIAQKLLGDEMRWPEIWKLNAGQTMPDGRIPANPDLIFPGWPLKLPITSPSEQPVQPPVEQPTTEPQPSEPLQPPSPIQPEVPQPEQPSKEESPTPTQPPVNTAEPAQTPAVTPTPATPLPQTTPAPQQPITQPTTLPSLDQPDTQQEDWLWPVLQGLGGLLALSGLGLGLGRVGGVLRRRRQKGELNEPRRSRWQAYREVNDWESENIPQTRARPIVQINEWGDESGFASTERPVELLKLWLNGFDADRPKLVLLALQNVFTEEELPPIQPIGCIEARSRLTYFFSGSPQALAAYLKGTSKKEIYDDNALSYSASSEDTFEDDEGEFECDDQEEDTASASHSNRGKVIPFLARLARKEKEDENNTQLSLEEEIGQDELVETLISKLGGRAWIEKQREGLVVIVENVEARYCYSPIAVGKNIYPQEGVIWDEIEYDAPAEFIPGEEFEGEDAIKAVEGEESEVYHAYGQEDEEAANKFDMGVSTIARPIHGLKVRSVDGVRQEFAQISTENLVSQIGLHHAENIDENGTDTSSAYLLFGLGAVHNKHFDLESASISTDEEVEATETSYGHFELCLDECGNLLLVASKGDEAASSVLYSCTFQMATCAGLDDLALYLIDRPVALSDDEIQTIGQEFGLSGEAQVTLAGELKHNREIFSLLAALPQTVAVVTGEARNRVSGQETGWQQNTVGVIEALLGELVRRRAEAASNEIDMEVEEKEGWLENKLPRLVLVISDLTAVVTADQTNALVQLLSDGPHWGIYVLAAISYEAVTGEINAGSGSLPSLIPQFGSLGLFLAPDEKSSEQLLNGSKAAFELSGDGDMFFRFVNRQHLRLRGFRAEAEEVRKSVELLQTLYNTPLAKGIDAECVILEEVGANEVKVASEEPENQSKITYLPSEPLPPQTTPSPTTQLEQGNERDFSALVGVWRWRMLQKGLLQPAITIHVLHGLTIHFALLPTAQKNRVGKGYYFPISPDALEAYAQLREVGLSYTHLAKAVREGNDNASLRLPESEVLKPQRIEELLTEVLKLQEGSGVAQSGHDQLATQLVAGGFDPQEMEEAFTHLQKLIHNFAWLESDNLLPRMQNGDLALLSYLALHSGAQSRYKVGQAILKPTETDKQLLRNLEVRLTRTHKSLRGWIAAGLQEIFSDIPEAKETIPNFIDTQKLYFIEDDTRRETLKLNDQLVWVDVGELDRLITLYRQSGTTAPARHRVEELEEAYWLVQSTAEGFSDEVAESRLKLLGVWGDHYAADWEDLTIMRQHIIQRWFDLNMALGDYYTNNLNNKEHDEEEHNRLVALAVEHYSQAALVQPTYPEPVKALIGLYHSTNDLPGLRVVFNDYCINCQQDDQEPEEDVVELYHKIVGSRKKRVRNTLAEERRVV